MLERVITKKCANCGESFDVLEPYQDRIHLCKDCYLKLEREADALSEALANEIDNGERYK